MATLCINRREWRRGGSNMALNEMYGDTVLLSANKMKCCLGFACLISGAPESSILDKGEPYQIKGGRDSISDIFGLLEGGYEEDMEDDDGKQYTEVSDLHNSDLTGDAIEINDNRYITEEEREAELTELFKKHGHTIEFYGETDPAYIAYLDRKKEESNEGHND